MGLLLLVANKDWQQIFLVADVGQLYWPMKPGVYKFCLNVANYFISVFISVQPSGRFWQEPELSQATGTALARCILGKFLGVVCHCFPLPLDVPTFAARCLHDPNNASASSSEKWNCGRERCPVILPKWRLFYTIYGSFTCRQGATRDRRLYFPSEGRHAVDFFDLKIRRLRPGLNPWTWVPEVAFASKYYTHY
jgi:hypothetical protein